MFDRKDIGIDLKALMTANSSMDGSMVDLPVILGSVVRTFGQRGVAGDLPAEENQGRCLICHC